MYTAISIIIFFIIIISAVLFYIAIKSFLKKKSNPIPVEFLQSMNYLMTDQHDKALDTFMSMVKVSKDTAETHIILGNMFRNRGEVDRAIRVHQNLIARPELHPKIRQECSIELAKDYLKAGFLDRAEIIFTKLSNEVKRPTRILYHLKEIYEQEKEWKKAIEVSSRIQSSSNEELSDIISHYYCELAEIQLSMAGNNSLAEARRYINKAIGYNKESIRALILLGDISSNNENYTDALKKYINIYENFPEESYLVLTKLKNVYTKLNKKDNFYDFLRSITNVRYPIDLYSNIHKSSDGNISNKEISDLYQNEFLNNRVNLSQLSDYLDLIIENKVAFDNKSLNNIKACLDVYSKKVSMHECSKCGYESTKHFWQCPSCHQWSTVRKNFVNNTKNHNYVVSR